MTNAMKVNVKSLPIVMFVLFIVSVALAQEAQNDSSDLAKQTQNPVSSVISIPFQFNFNSGGGYADKTF